MSDEAVQAADAAETSQVAPAEAVDAGIDPSAEVAALRAELEQQKRKNEYLVTSHAAARKPSWVAEARRLHPELDAIAGRAVFEKIEATSRREFQREAERLAELHRPSITALRQLKEQASTALDAAREEAVAEARAQVAEAWGRPSADVISGPTRAEKDDKAKAETLRKLIES